MLALLGASCGGDDDDVVAGGDDNSDESSDDSSDESSDDSSDESSDDSSDESSDDSSDESSDDGSDESSDDDGGSSGGDFCEVGEEIDASNAMLDETDDPEELEDGISDILDVLEDSRGDAPDDIADDFNAVVDAYAEVDDVLGSVGYDFEAVEDEDDVAVFENFAEAVVPVEEWFVENCGIDVGGDDGSSDDGGSTDGGSGEGGLATVTPDDIADLEPGLSAPGPDAGFDALWEDCADGSLEACDELYFATPVGSLYEAFGATCGARNLESDFVGVGACAAAEGDDGSIGGTGDGGFATATGSEDLDGDSPAPGPDSTLDALWEDCGDGDDSACDELWQGSPFDSVYELYATTCGGREPDNASGNPCV